MAIKESEKSSSGKNSLYKLADSLVYNTIRILEKAHTEEDLRIGFEKLLDPIKNELGIRSEPKYEKSIFKGRSDAVHGQVVIEYEPPGSFSSDRKVQKAYEQLIDYLIGESTSTKLYQLIGVGFDGNKIFFVRYVDKEYRQIDKTKFSISGPFDFNTESAKTFLIHLRALSRLPLTAENLSKKFGPQSEMAQKAVSAFANALEYWGEQTRIRTFYDEWKRIFGIVYGEQFNNDRKEKVTLSLSRLYKVGRETDFQELLFSIHTYFAFLMKLIAAELLTLKETGFGSSFALELAHSSDEELKRKLEDIEEGGIYARKGITNFLEGDFFRWYLDAFDSPELREVLREIARQISEFEPATSSLDPRSTRDLLKKLYQYLVPQEVRHRLGEYYTPDWLAELVIKEVGYDGNNSKRLLDPACGSGTFLVLAIQKAKEWGLKNKRHALDIAKSIKANIWGFDLNPLAVIAARTNYLFALGDFVDEMLNKGESIEIPVYLTDSVLTPTRITGNLFGEFLEVATSVGKFQIPAEWVRMGGFLLSRAAPLIEEMAENQYSIEEAMERFKKEGLVFPYNQETVKNFYNQILELQKQNKNGIWARFLKNAFAPMIAGKFDYVIGNPPWIRWEYLSREYREATKNQWESYGLSIIRESKDTLGRGKKDFSMLFVYASVDYYLKNGGKLAFLITQEVFKSKSSGEGFRRFQLGNKIYLKVLRAHDLVLIKPFERASNKTAAIILKKGEKTEYPVPYIVWLKRKGVTKISPDTLLNEVFKLTNRKKMLAKPISSETSPWQNYERAGHLLPVKGLNYYRAKIGARTEPYSIFWLKIIDIISGGNLLIENITEGKRKKQIKKLEARIIENEFVYPSLRGADVSRWGYKAQLYTLILNDPDNPTKPFPEKLMKLKFPLTYSYLLNFKSELLDREAYKKFHLKAGRPFYAQFNISRDTFANYKVVWKRMTDDIFACVLPPIKTLFGYKAAIPLDTTSFIAASSELEAHYLCSILNSKLVREFIRSFSSTGRGFGSPSVINYLGIPRFDTNNLLHRNIADISKKFHQLKIEGNDIEIKKLEKENDELIKKLFRIRN